jgi:hypothetical protein
MSADYVYRLRVKYPEGVDEDNPPKGWEPRWGDSHEREEERFRWPALRRCLSLSTAKRWADQLRAWGCEVEVERSLPVKWPTSPSEAALRRIAVLQALAAGDVSELLGVGPAGRLIRPAAASAFPCREPGCDVGSDDEDWRDAHEYLVRHGDYGPGAETWIKEGEDG